MTAQVMRLDDARRRLRLPTRAERLHVLGVEMLEECCDQLRKWRTASQMRDRLHCAFSLLLQAEALDEMRKR
jgi:hypothetical protein